MAFKKLGILFRLGIVLAIVGFSGLPARAQGVGSVDPTFTPSIEFPEAGAGRSLQALAIQPDGKILVSGDFSTVNGVSRRGLVRFNPDGTVDPSFSANVSSVFGIAVQPDGKILIAGSFARVNGVLRSGFARLNADGSPDTAFNIGTGVTRSGSPDARGVLAQSDGRCLVYGRFNTFNGAPCAPIIRINADGTLDSSFDPFSNNAILPGGEVNSVILQPDGKIIAVGPFTAPTDPVSFGVTRLNPNGSTDSTFTPVAGIGGGTTVALQSDGKILIGGFFRVANGSPRTGLVRLNPNGTLDQTFTTEIAGTDPFVFAVTVYPDDRILVAGQFSAIGGVSRTGFARLAADGTPDPAYNPVFAPAPSNQTLLLDSIIIQADGRAVVIGDFVSVNGVTSRGLARLSEAGDVDTQFLPRFNIVGTIFASAVQPDGRILVGGNFGIVNGVSRNGIARINADGSLDTTFDPGSGIAAAPNSGSTPFVATLALQSDGKVLIGGIFTRVNNTSQSFLARLNADGSVDSGFSPAIGEGSSGFPVRAVVLQPDGKIVIGGEFRTVNGVSRPRIARLNPDGSVDSSFTPGTGATATSSLPLVNAVGVTSDGKILIGGFFENYNGVTRNSLARLNADGTLDGAFNPGAGPVGQVETLAVQPDGRVLAGGGFTSFAGVPRRAVVRLNVNGTIDTTFVDPNLLDEQSLDSAALSRVGVLPDGRIFIAGRFTTVGGQPARGIARLNSNGTPDAAFNTGAGVEGVFTFSLDQNGNFIIAGSFTSVNQLPRTALARLVGDTPVSCNYGLSASSATFPVVGGTGSVTIVTGAGCPWQTTNVPSWITGLTLSGVGTATLNYTVAANTGPARTATLLIGGVVYTVTQADGCVRTLSATSANFDPIGGTGSVTLTTDAICPWTVTGVPFWISGIPTSGVGTRTFTFTVAQLTAGGSRSAIIQFGGQPFTVTQSGCAYTVSPTTIPISTSGGTTALSVTSSSGCPWTAASTVPWITIVSGVRGTGNGTVQIEIAPGSGRSGTFTVAGQTVRVVQGQPAFSIATCGQFRPTTGFVYLRNSNTSGFAENEFFYGQAGDQPLAGDWNGDGTDTIGIYRNGTFFLRNSNNSGFADIQFPFGAPGDIAIVGDWNGDGIDTVGIIRGNAVFLRNTNTAGNADLQFNYGTETDIFIVGDWNGDGIDTIGAFRPSNGFVYLRNSNATGVADLEFFYGQAGDRPVVGDWNGDGVDTIGVVRGNQWFLRNSNSSGFADIEFAYGTDTDIPIVGNWDGLP